MDELKVKDDKGKKILNFSIIFLGLFLNQSNVIFGINLSIADFIMLTIFFLLLVKNQLFFPAYYLLVFFAFSAYIILNTILIVPRGYGIPISNIAVIRDYIKISTVFLYFILAFHIVRLNLLDKFLKYFLIFSVLVGSLGIVILFFYPIPVLTEVMLFGGVRLNGFMNDPNYFSIIQIAALSIALGIEIPNKLIKFSSIIILLVSIILSGSKTGFITLTCFLILKLGGKIKEKKLKKSNILVFLFICFLLSLSTFFIVSNVLPFLQGIAKDYPVMGRVILLFTNFEEAVSQDGSSRGLQWEIGYKMMKGSPLNGVGIGDNYLKLASEINENANLAHNTYIQMAAEWGIPVTSIFLTYIFIILSSKNPSMKNKQLIIINEIFVIFLVSSLAISFNYSRLFWMLLGMKTYLFLYERKLRMNQYKNLQVKRQ